MRRTILSRIFFASTLFFLIGLSPVFAQAPTTQAGGGVGAPTTQAGGAPLTDGTKGFQLQNPLTVNSICGLIQKLLSIVLSVGMPIAALFLAYAGFKFVLAKGNATALIKARDNLMYVFLGIFIFMAAWLLGQVILHDRVERFYEVLAGLLGAVHAAGGYRDYDAHQCCVAAVFADGIVNEIKLGGEFVGDDAALGLIPVINQALVVAAGDDVTVDVNGACGSGDIHASAFRGLPAGTGQAVLGRMRRLAGALAAEIGDEEVGAALGSGIPAGHDVVGLKNIELGLFDHAFLLKRPAAGR